MSESLLLSLLRIFKQNLLQILNKLPNSNFATSYRLAHNPYPQ